MQREYENDKFWNDRNIFELVHTTHVSSFGFGIETGDCRKGWLPASSYLSSASRPYGVYRTQLGPIWMAWSCPPPPILFTSPSLFFSQKPTCSTFLDRGLGYTNLKVCPSLFSCSHHAPLWPICHTLDVTSSSPKGDLELSSSTHLSALEGRMVVDEIFQIEGHPWGCPAKVRRVSIPPKVSSSGADLLTPVASCASGPDRLHSMRLVPSLTPLAVRLINK